MDKVAEITENMRSGLEGAAADFIDLVSYGNGKGVVLAKYPDQATMDAATETAQQAFRTMIEAGAIEDESVHAHAGEVFKSF